MNPRIRTSVLVTLGLLLAGTAAWWLQRPANNAAATPAANDQGRANGAAPAASGPARPPTVEVARARTMRLVDDATTVGSLRSRQTVMLRPEVAGRVVRIGFRDGERVRRGQVLVQMDDQLTQAQVKQAEAEMSIARANDKRNRELVAQGFISQRSVDESAANLQVADAKLALAKATAARLKIVAPFDGVAGLRNINVGDYLKDGTDIVNIEDLDAVLIDFRLPERYQTRIERGQRAQVVLDALPGKRYAAKVDAIDPLVDANGRSVGVRGCIDNRAGELRPGMFARVTAVFAVRENAVVVPEEAIVPQGGRSYVMRVVDGPDPDSRVARRVEVKTGTRLSGKVEIVQGLQAGDLIVTAGQQRVQKDGMPVRATEQGAAGGVGGAAAIPDGPTSAPQAAPAAVPAPGAAVTVRSALAPAVEVAGAVVPMPRAGDPCNGR